MVIQSADQLCTAAEAVLRTNIPLLLASEQVLAMLGDDAEQLDDIKTWQQLPVVEALAAAQLPAFAITSPGITGRPTYSRSSDTWSATFVLGVGAYDRGRDHTHTSARVRNWIAIARMAIQLSPSLGGVVNTATWAGERYDLFPQREQARTFGGGAVTFDVTADVPQPSLIPTGPDAPLVLSTPSALVVTPPGGIQ